MEVSGRVNVIVKKRLDSCQRFAQGPFPFAIQTHVRPVINHTLQPARQMGRMWRERRLMPGLLQVVNLGLNLAQCRARCAAI